MTDFATAADVAAIWRPLSDAETVVATRLCGYASVMIRAQYPDVDARIAGGNVAAAAVTYAAASMVKSAMLAGGDGVTQQSETIGPFSQSQSYANPTGSLFITSAIDKLIRGYRPKAQSIRYANATTPVYDGG